MQKKITLFAFAMLIIMGIASIAQSAFAGGESPTLVREVERTQGSIPGYMVYPREFADKVSVFAYINEGPKEGSTVLEADICEGMSAYEAADWLEILPAYVTKLPNEPNAFSIHLPSPTWVKVDMGRLEHKAGQEITAGTDLAKSREAYIQNATWRCKSQYDLADPPKPMGNVQWVGSAYTPPANGGEDGFSNKTVRSWCVTHCVSLQLEDRVEFGNAIVVMAYQDGKCSEFNVPAGYTIDTGQLESGPISKCINGATFRKSP